jgi:hypothetical protein
VNSSGNIAIIVSRFSSMYETPDGVRALSSSTMNSSGPVRTRSMPTMWV